MNQHRHHATCGFVPPYILKSLADSDDSLEESRDACQYTIKHAQSYAGHRHKLCTKNHSQPQKQHTAQAPLAADTGSKPTKLHREIYDCKESEILPGTLVRSEGQARIKDRQVNNCYDGFKITFDFYSKVFGRNSLDGSGLPLIGSVHFKLNDSPAGYNNAYWDGEANCMVFGDGDHIAFDYLTDSLDVIAHELSHGFVQYSSPLDYVGQSGALNESCADVFGCMAEQFHMKQTVEEADWNLGQTLFPVAFTGSALRTLKAGKAYEDDPVFGTDPQPKHMRDLYTGEEDGGGVHINSGIPNHAFYLASVALGGNSWEKAGMVWYKTMTSGEVAVDCDFATFAAITIKVAGLEFEDCEVQEAVRQAWEDVGVGKDLGQGYTPATKT